MTTQPTTEAGRKLIADLWGAGPEGEIAKTAAQEQWWNAAILAIEAEAQAQERARLKADSKATAESAQLDVSAAVEAIKAEAQAEQRATIDRLTGERDEALGELDRIAPMAGVARLAESKALAALAES